MKLKNTPELLAFFSNYILDGEQDADSSSTEAFLAATSTDRQLLVIAQAKRLLADPEFPVDELGTEANRWFADAEGARTWLRVILAVLEGAQREESIAVKDSNGAELLEGDSVQVIKDLKVKGGSSDLKRGTLIKKIHLIGDPENIECRVDGSTLVLKTCFLKKA